MLWASAERVYDLPSAGNAAGRRILARLDHWQTARAVCDANGWELIRVYLPGGDSDRPAGTPAKGDRPLSPGQITTLAIESGRTHRALGKMGLVTDSEDDWRHAEVWRCVRREGLRDCANSHFRKLLIHFRGLRGVKTKGGDAGRKWSGESGDSGERREQILRRLAAELREHARRVESPVTPAEQAIADAAAVKGIIGEAYLMQIARAKNRAETLHDFGCLIKLPASRLEQLHSTLRNRIAAREGRGDAARRNKSQRKRP